MNLVYYDILLTLFCEAPSGYSITAPSFYLRPNMHTRLEEGETTEELLTVAAKEEATEQQESSQEQCPDEDEGLNSQLISVGDHKEGSSGTMVKSINGKIALHVGS